MLGSFLIIFVLLEFVMKDDTVVKALDLQSSCCRFDSRL